MWILGSTVWYCVFMSKRRKGKGETGEDGRIPCYVWRVMSLMKASSPLCHLPCQRQSTYTSCFFFFLTYCSFFPPFSRDRLCVFPRFSLLALRLSIRAAVVSLPRERMNGVSGPSAGKGGRHFFILKRQLFFFGYVDTMATREFMSPCYALFHETHDWFFRFSFFSFLLFLVWTVFIVQKL